MVRPCMSTADALALRNLTANGYVADLICDPWAGTHVVGPFFAYCFMQNWAIVFLLTGVNELWESVVRALNAGQGVPLFEDFEGEGLGESLTQALVDDWLTQGALGLLIGGFFMYHIASYSLLSVKIWRNRRRQWYFYAAILVLWYAIYPLPPQSTLKVAGGGSATLPRIAGFAQDKSDAWIGFAGVVIYHGILVVQTWAVEPYFSQAWSAEPEWKRPYFWCGAWVISAAFEIQSTWDYFYSSAVQTWLIAGVISAYLLILAVARHRLDYFVERFDSWAAEGAVDVIKSPKRE